MRGVGLFCPAEETGWRSASGESRCQRADAGFSMACAQDLFPALPPYIDGHRSHHLAGGERFAISSYERTIETIRGGVA